MTDAPDPPSSPQGAPPEGPGTGAAPVGYRVQLPTFEGPLDLLLHLIEEHELDIRDIPIAFIAAKYVEYIRAVPEGFSLLMNAQSAPPLRHIGADHVCAGFTVGKLPPDASPVT